MALLTAQAILVHHPCLLSSLQPNRVSKSLQTRLQTASLTPLVLTAHCSSTRLMAIGELNQRCLANAYQMDCLLFVYVGIVNRASPSSYAFSERSGLRPVSGHTHTHISPLFSRFSFSSAWPCRPYFKLRRALSLPSSAFSHAAMSKANVWAANG